MYASQNTGSRTDLTLLDEDVARIEWSDDGRAFPEVTATKFLGEPGSLNGADTPDATPDARLWIGALHAHTYTHI